MLTIDGAQGEGGGQVLRTSLSLSAVTGKAFRLERIRSKRPKPGLLRQHLTAVNAMAEICSARVAGAELGSGTLTFEPGAVRHGRYHFAVGTAGSTTLVFQTVLPALLMAAGRSQLTFEGGTHNPLAPSFECLARSFVPQLARMGAQLSLELQRPGFYPAGGGQFTAALEGGHALAPLELVSRGPLREVRIEAVVSRLPVHIAQRETSVLERDLSDYPLSAQTSEVQSGGPGNAATVTVHSEALCETFVAFGQVGVRAETVAHRLAGQVRKYLASSAPVGEHLADQLLVPLALAGAGVFRTHVLSQHTRTNADVIAAFSPVRFEFEQHTDQSWTVRARRAGGT